MKLNEEIQQVLASYAVPQDVGRTIARAMAQIEENQVAPGLAVGERAPDFCLPNQNREEICLRNVLAQGPVVLTFYRGEWCPVCNLQIAALQRALPDIQAAGARLVAVSPQGVDRAAEMSEKHQASFDLLSDAHQETIRAYRLQYTVPPEVQEVYLGVFHMDLSERNADGSWNLPVPGTFILDQEGIVRVRHVTADYTRRMEPEDVIAALEGLRATVAP